MKIFGKLIKLILIGVNIVIAFGYLLCAYSPYIRPQSHPILACAGLAIPIFIFLNLACIIGWLFIRRRYSLFSLVVLFMGFGSLRAYWPIGFADRGDAASDTIKFLTYNTQGMPWGDVDKDGINPILAYLKESEADIICLQEFIPGIHVSEKVINETLSDYPYHEKVAFGDGGNGMACYSRYPILSAERIRYESAMNGSMLFRLKVGEDTLVVINNHLESNKLNSHDKEMYTEMLKKPEEEMVKENSKFLLRKLADAVAIRAPQVDSVALAIRRNESPYMIVCGDFNDSPVSYAHRTIGKGLNDAFINAGGGPGFSYNQSLLYFRIDHIFASDAFKILHCEVDRSIRVSDHYPVWCLLQKKK